MMQPTVFVVDDDPASRDSLSLLLETAGLAVVCHDSAESFLAAYRDDLEGCLVLDVRMGGMNGPELHAELVRRGCHLPIIYLTAYGDIPMTVRAMKAGALDFLTKPVDASQLLEHVQAALQRNRETFAQRESLNNRRQRLADLTPREQEIMALVLAGQSNKVIAKQLGISHCTVEIHRSHLLHKTGVASVLELAQLAAECGFQASAPPPDEDGTAAGKD